MPFSNVGYPSYRFETVDSVVHCVATRNILPIALQLVIVVCVHLFYVLPEYCGRKQKKLGIVLTRTWRFVLISVFMLLSTVAEVVTC